MVRCNGILTELAAMEIVFPLLVRVLGWESNRLLSSNQGVVNIHSLGPEVVLVFFNVHVPNSDHEIPEFRVSFNLSVSNCVILNEVFKRNNFLVTETLVCAV